ncbi:MAG: FHA domain-containing protein [bacterium]|nr:FHA domain-containing protein [bacterium]
MANYVLEILDGDRAGEVLSVPDGALRIGRKPANDLVLADEKTSGVHAEIVLEGDRHVLRDLGSTNGTFIDGKRVTEVVLSAGDIITVGRLRVSFRDESAAAGAGDGGEFAVHRIDASRARKGGGSMLLLGLLVLVGGGVGGYLWWSGQQQQGTTAGGPVKQTPPMTVSGNKLADSVANCESDDGWVLGAHGVAFQPGGLAHTGSGGLEAVRVEGNATDFAIATPAKEVTVFSGRSVEVAAHIQTDGGGMAGVRGVFSSSKDPGQVRFRTGTAIAASAGEWTRVAFEAGVPPGCDQLLVEVVAVLPGDDAVAMVDDVAVVEAGSAKSLEAKIEEGGQTVLGTGSALAARSTETTLLAIVPGSVRSEFAGLHGEDLCVLSDLGASLEATPGDRGLSLSAKGCDALRFVFPADAAGQVLARVAADGDFAPVAAALDQNVVELLLGSAVTRAMLRPQQADGTAGAKITGKVGNGLYRLDVASAMVELVFGFRSEGQRARELQRQAEAARRDGKLGDALDRLGELQRQAPHQSQVLADASTKRSEILAGLDDELATLQREFGEAEFFDTRGGFDRVAAGVDGLEARYGANNLATRPLAKELRSKSRDRLAALDGQRRDDQKQQLEALSKAFLGAGHEGLAKLVQDYSARYLGK